MAVGLSELKQETLSFKQETSSNEACSITSQLVNESPLVRARRWNSYLRVHPAAGKDSAAVTTLEIKPTVKTTDIPAMVRAFPPATPMWQRWRESIRLVSATSICHCSSSSSVRPLSVFHQEQASGWIGSSLCLLNQCRHDSYNHLRLQRIVPRALLEEMFSHMEERDAKYVINMSYM